jgi:hypothetical protein
MEEERTKAKAVIDSMKEELQRVVQMSQEFLTPRSKAPTIVEESESSSSKPIVRRGYLSAGSARRSSRKRPSRGRDSGMGLLDEDEEEFF